MLKAFTLLFLIIFTHITIANTLGEAFISLGDSRPQRVNYEIIDNKAIIEGDVILGNVDTIRQQGAVAIKHPNRRWPQALIPFEFDRNISIHTKQLIFLAYVHFQQFTPMRFVERTRKNKDQYPNYVRFTKGSGCSSYVGQIGGMQEIVLGKGCGYGVIIHEIGHALGLWHEQNRIDRDNHVIINFENVRPEKRHNFQQYLDNSIDIDGYDYDSIMHYGAYDFSVNGKKTIVVLDGRHEIGQRRGLSQGDIAGISLLYSD